MTIDKSVIDTLADMVKTPIVVNAPLSRWTTLRVGGPAEAVITVEDEVELQAVLSFCRKSAIQWDVLGKGSNILAADDGYHGIIIILGNNFTSIDIAAHDATMNFVRIGAAASLTAVGEWALARGLGGFEFAAGIPGTIGGALAMNAGAWGEEIGSLVRQVELVNDEKVQTLASDSLTFQYRCWDDLQTSLSGYVIVAVTIELQVSHPETIKSKMRKYRRRRKETQPIDVPSAGSFFKNPAAKSAGQLIEASGLKGAQVGDAEVSEKHANFLINRGNATAADMIELMRHVQRQVKKDSNIVLEPEVYFLK